MKVATPILAYKQKMVLTKFRGSKISKTFVIQIVSEESREHKVDVHEILPPFGRLNDI